MRVKISIIANKIYAIALALPILKYSKAFLYIAYTRTFVESNGPPSVIKYIKSKTWNEVIAVTIITKKIVGDKFFFLKQQYMKCSDNTFDL